MTKSGKLLRYDDRIRKRVRPGEKVPLKLCLSGWKKC